MVGTYGSFERQTDGRDAGLVLHVNRPRRDGKYPVVYIFGNGRRIAKIYTAEKVAAAIAKIKG